MKYLIAVMCVCVIVIFVLYPISRREQDRVWFENMRQKNFANRMMRQFDRGDDYIFHYPNTELPRGFFYRFDMEVIDCKNNNNQLLRWAKVKRGILLIDKHTGYIYFTDGKPFYHRVW